MENLKVFMVDLYYKQQKLFTIGIVNPSFFPRPGFFFGTPYHSLFLSNSPPECLTSYLFTLSPFPVSRTIKRENIFMNKCAWTTASFHWSNSANHQLPYFSEYNFFL